MRGCRDCQIPQFAELLSRASKQQTCSVVPQHSQRSQLLGVHMKGWSLINPYHGTRHKLKKTLRIWIWLQRIKSCGDSFKCCREPLHTLRANVALSGARPKTLKCKQDAPSHVHSRPLVGRTFHRSRLVSQLGCPSHILFCLS